MKLKDFATPLAAKNNFIKASFGGFAGSGKSRTASEFIVGAHKYLKCDKPVLFIDNEKGSRFLVPFFKEHGIETYVKDTIHLADVLAAFDLLESGDISFLFIDSLTKVWYRYVDDYKQKQRNKQFMTLQDWGKILPSWQKDFADRFVSVDGNVVFTGRGGNTYDMEENQETHKKEFVKSGVKMKMAGETPFEPDMNIWMSLMQKVDADGNPVIWRDALVMKDRSGKIDGLTFSNPTFENFKPVVEYLVNVDKGEVAGATDTDNLAPSEPQYHELKDQRQIEEDNIKATWDISGLGTSKEDKIIKVKVTEAIFGTRSWTEITKMDLGVLKGKRQELDAFMKQFCVVEDRETFLNLWLEEKAKKGDTTLFDEKIK
jgi:hypothetical protein